MTMTLQELSYEVRVSAPAISYWMKRGYISKPKKGEFSEEQIKEISEYAAMNAQQKKAHNRKRRINVSK